MTIDYSRGIICPKVGQLEPFLGIWHLDWETAISLHVSGLSLLNSRTYRVSCFPFCGQGKQKNLVYWEKVEWSRCTKQGETERKSPLDIHPPGSSCATEFLPLGSVRQFFGFMINSPSYLIRSIWISIKCIYKESMFLIFVFNVCFLI